MTEMKISQKAPEFCLLDSNEKEVCLRNFSGKFIVLYFYPKDNTPGCTIEANDFTKLAKEFEKENAIVLGISKDSCQSHQKFVNDQKLGITLLSDEKTEVQQKYGVWKLKQYMGKEYMGTVRSTFIIDPNGIIVKIWDAVKPEGHAQEVLDELKKIKKENEST